MTVYFEPRRSAPWWAGILADIGGEFIGNAIRRGQEGEVNRKQNAFMAELAKLQQPQEEVNFDMQPSGQYSLNGVISQPEQPLIRQMQPIASTKEDFTRRAMELAGSRRFGGLEQPYVQSAIQSLSGLYDDRARDSAIDSFDITNPQGVIKYALRHGGQNVPQITNWLEHFNPKPTSVQVDTGNAVQYGTFNQSPIRSGNPYNFFGEAQKGASPSDVMKNNLGQAELTQRQNEFEKNHALDIRQTDISEKKVNSDNQYAKDKAAAYKQFNNEMNRLSREKAVKLRNNAFNSQAAEEVELLYKELESKARKRYLAPYEEIDESGEENNNILRFDPATGTFK